MFNHHNPTISRPLTAQLISALGDKWSESHYGNDELASISNQLNEDEWIQIFIPNAIDCEPMNEEHSTFHVNVSDSHYLEFDTIGELLEALKDGARAFANSPLVYNS
jgi:hypothetical protein|tara:strand:+ start:39 stop:359 length:321 start_codon:yes stop_codon:yes gene_type:complete